MTKRRISWLHHAGGSHAAPFAQADAAIGRTKDIVAGRAHEPAAVHVRAAAAHDFGQPHARHRRRSCLDLR
jgi:hypothetical protein